MSDYSAKEISEALQEFLNARYVRIGGKKYLPVEDGTAHQFLMKLANSRLEKEYDDDDFRSRA